MGIDFKTQHTTLLKSNYYIIEDIILETQTVFTKTLTNQGHIAYFHFVPV